MTPSPQKSHTIRTENQPGAEPASASDGTTATMLPLRQQRRKLWRTRLFSLLKLAGVIAAVALCWQYLYDSYGNDPRAWLEQLRSTSPWLFIAAIAALPLVGFPISVCYLFAGAAFGVFYGWLYCMIGLAAGMSFSFFISRTLLRRPLQGLLESWARRIPDLNPRHHTRAVLLVRLVPGLSFMLQNPLLALLNIPFPTFIGLSLLSHGLVCLLMCAVGAVDRQPYPLTVALVIFALIGISLLVHFGVRRGWKRSAKPDKSVY